MTPSVRIVHYFPSRSWGGAEIYVYELTRDQARRGLDVVVWGYEESRLIDECLAAGVQVLCEDVEAGFHFSRNQKRRKIVRRERFTHVFLHSSDAVNAFAGAKDKVQYIYYVHMWVKHRKKDPLHWWLYRYLDHVIVAGARARDAVLKCLPVASEKIVLLPYAIDQSLTSNLKTTRADWGLPEDRMVFGIFARLDAQKGQREFLEALSITLKKDPNACVGLIVGDATYGEDEASRYSKWVDERIAQPDLRGHVLRFPFRTDFRELLQHCDVLVAPSYHESYALILLHAFSLGVPVLSTDSGGTPDLVTSDRGWLVPPRTVSELSDTMSALLTQSAAVHQKGLAAQNYVQSVHTFTAVSEKLHECLVNR